MRLCTLICRLKDIDEQVVINDFRFGWQDLDRLVVALRLPDEYVCCHGTNAKGNTSSIISRTMLKSNTGANC